MTLLVPRESKEDDKYQYAIQMSYPTVDQRTGREAIQASVRLIDRNRKQVGAIESLTDYNPKDWRAATVDEQSKYMQLHDGDFPPWFPDADVPQKNVYDYPESGDRTTNNDQMWDEIDDSLIAEWSAERKRRNASRSTERQ